MTTGKVNVEPANSQKVAEKGTDNQHHGKRRGPKTREGKATVRHNAVRNGLTARIPVIPGVEQPEEWEAFRASVIESFAPDEGIEKFLAQRIAELSWRLARVPKFEAWAVTYATLEEGGRASLEMAVRPAFVLQRPNREQSGEENPPLAPFCLPDSSVLDKLMRYEAHMAKQRTQDLHELEALQARRRGERTALARLDVTGLPERA